MANIQLVAYADRDPNYCFVKIPNERGRYVRTDTSVITVGCRTCKATVGEPCRRDGWGYFRPETQAPDFKYGVMTHSDRREDARRVKRMHQDAPRKPHYRYGADGIELVAEGSR